MKIIEENQNLMVLKDSKLMAMVIAFAFLSISVFLFFHPIFFEVKGDVLPPIAGPIFFSLIGLFIILFAKKTEVLIDKNRNQLLIERKSIITRKKEEYRVDEIKRVELQRKKVEHEKSVSYVYNLAFILNNGREVILPSGITISISGIISKKGDSKIGERIALFLNVPFEERRDPTLSESISAIKEVVREEMQKKQQEKKE